MGVLAVLTARVTKASWNGSKKGEWERKILAQKRAEEKEKIKTEKKEKEKKEKKKKKEEEGANVKKAEKTTLNE